MLTGGTIIGTYRVLNKIGEGGMGSVYLGEHTLLGRKAAIKVLLPSLSANEEVVKRFFNEARAVTRIADPGIVQVFDFGHHTDGSAFIVMELLEGEPMDQRLKRVGRFGVFECLRLMRLICTSLGVAHGKGIVHRDLKPENIFLVEDPSVVGGERPKVLDFGIAKLAGDEPGKLKTRTDVLMGTPMYMSPEQCRGGGVVDYRSDIYTIGCVMFIMLTGRPPFDGAGAGDLIAAHLRELPPLASSRVPEMPGVVDQILQKCLRKSPSDRFQSMAELARALGLVEQALTRSIGTVDVVEPIDDFLRSKSAPLFEPQAPTKVLGRVVPTPVHGETKAKLTGTTLNDASGQTSAPMLARKPQRLRSQRWLIGLLAGAVLVGGGVTFIAFRGDQASPQASSAAAVGGNAADEAHPRPTVVDAIPAAAPQPLPAEGSARTVVTAAQDGGVSDAPFTKQALDAVVPPLHRPNVGNKGLRKPSAGGDHANSTGSAEPSIIDRGD